MKLWARRGFEWAEKRLVGLWCPVLTGATGSTLLDCNPATNNHGVLTNQDRNTSWIGSPSGTIIDFDGTTDQVLNTAPQGIGAVTSQAFSFWVNLRSLTVANNITLLYLGRTGSPFSQQIAVGFNIFGQGPSNNTSAFNVLQYSGSGNPTGAYTSATFGGRLNEWINFVCGWDGSAWRIFVNGAEDTVAYLSGGPTTGFSLQMSIGAGQTGVGTNWGRFFDGRIGEVVYWHRFPTRSEIQSIYQVGLGGAWQLTPPSRRYATILANAYTLIAASSSYSITGQPVGLLAGRLLTADAASYLLAGNATGLNAGRLLTANSAAYALTGQDANLLAGRLLSGDTATYDLVGSSANLLASRALQANSAQYTVAGSDAALLAGRLLDCGSSAFLLSPNQAGLLAARKLTADQASVLLTTQATNLYAGRKITADTAQFILVASPVDLTFGGGGAAPYYYLFLLGGSR